MLSLSRDSNNQSTASKFAFCNPDFFKTVNLTSKLEKPPTGFTAWSYPARISILAPSPSSALHFSGASDAKLCRSKAGSMQWCYSIAHLHSYFRQWNLSCFQKGLILFLRNLLYLLATVNTLFHMMFWTCRALKITRQQHLKWSWRNDDLLVLYTKHEAPNMQVIADGKKLHISKYRVSSLLTWCWFPIFAVVCCSITHSAVCSERCARSVCLGHPWDSVDRPCMP